MIIYKKSKGLKTKLKHPTKRIRYSHFLKGSSKNENWRRMMLLVVHNLSTFLI